VLATLLLALLLAPPAAGEDGAARWRAPVAGPVARAFDLGADPFEAGRHRGADFAAAPGAPVRAACAGRVEVARRVGASGRVVTVLCGRWRASVMPLAQVAVRAGDAVTRGERVGTAAVSARHRGIHFGVRRDGDRFGYVDPLRFLARGSDRLPPPMVGPPPRRTPPPARPAGPAAPAPRTAPAPRIAGANAPALRSAPAAAGSSPLRARGERALAPWPVWAGLALLLSGAVGGGVAGRARRRRAGLPWARPQQIASPP
jgi:hypothetical protein